MFTSGQAISKWGFPLLMRFVMAVFAVFVTAVLATTPGCRSTKVIRKAMAVQHKDTTAATPERIVDSLAGTHPSAPDLHEDSFRTIHQAFLGLASNHIDFNTFSGRVRVNYEGGDGNEIDVTAYIHIKKDSMIWISINAGLGIEAFRMLITRDSVKILDKVKHVARLRSVNYLQQEINLPIDFSSLQDLLIGNPVFLDTAGALFYKRDQSGLSIQTIGTLFRNYITLDTRDNTLKHSVLDNHDPLQVLNCDLTYGDYEQKGSIKFAAYRKIVVAAKSNLDMELQFKQYNFNEDLSFSFSIPKNYKRK